ncbi:hypothetical protein J6590_036630 [Homalodisca vitripennis]|nr:hypothetical protein J6590_036630 [Homalodisca vitripennis]
MLLLLFLIIHWCVAIQFCINQKHRAAPSSADWETRCERLYQSACFIQSVTCLQFLIIHGAWRYSLFNQNTAPRRPPPIGRLGAVYQACFIQSVTCLQFLIIHRCVAIQFCINQNHRAAPSSADWETRCERLYQSACFIQSVTCLQFLIIHRCVAIQFCINQNHRAAPSSADWETRCERMYQSACFIQSVTCLQFSSSFIIHWCVAIQFCINQNHRAAPSSADWETRCERLYQSACFIQSVTCLQFLIIHRCVAIQFCINQNHRAAPSSADWETRCERLYQSACFIQSVTCLQFLIIHRCEAIQFCINQNHRAAPSSADWETRCERLYQSACFIQSVAVVSKCMFYSIGNVFTVSHYSPVRGDTVLYQSEPPRRAVLRRLGDSL